VNLKKLYDSPYLGAREVSEYLAAQRKPHIVAVIKDVAPVELFNPRTNQKEQKPVITCTGMTKAIVWGKTKCRPLVDAWGYETDTWRGKSIRIGIEQTGRGPALILRPATDAEAEGVA
jgi:hypothetical protein